MKVGLRITNILNIFPVCMYASVCVCVCVCVWCGMFVYVCVCVCVCVCGVCGVCVCVNVGTSIAQWYTCMSDTQSI